MDRTASRENHQSKSAFAVPGEHGVVLPEQIPRHPAKGAPRPRLLRAEHHDVGLVLRRHEVRGKVRDVTRLRSPTLDLLDLLSFAIHLRLGVGRLRVARRLRLGLGLGLGRGVGGGGDVLQTHEGRGILVSVPDLGVWGNRGLRSRSRSRLRADVGRLEVYVALFFYHHFVVVVVVVVVVVRVLVFVESTEARALRHVEGDEVDAEGAAGAWG